AVGAGGMIERPRGLVVATRICRLAVYGLKKPEVLRPDAQEQAIWSAIEQRARFDQGGPGGLRPTRSCKIASEPRQGATECRSITVGAIERDRALIGRQRS